MTIRPRSVVPISTLLLVACSSSGPSAPPEEAFRGLWRVTAVNGSPLPAATPGGATFIGGWALLYWTEMNGSIASAQEHCVQDGPSPSAVFDQIRWGIIGGDSVEVHYPFQSGLFIPIDTVILTGATLRWRSHNDGATGVADWTLELVTHDQNVDPLPHACP